MSRLKSLLFTLLVAALTQGCLAGYIHSRGSHHPHGASFTLPEVRAALGEPVRILDYPEPQPLGETPEYRHFVGQTFMTYELGAEDTPHAQLETPVAHVESYRIQGALADPTRAQPHVMLVVMTAGFAELLDPFMSIYTWFWVRPELQAEVVYLTYWYDADGASVAHIHNDLWLEAAEVDQAAGNAPPGHPE